MEERKGIQMQSGQDFSLLHIVQASLLDRGSIDSIKGTGTRVPLQKILA